MLQRINKIVKVFDLFSSSDRASTYIVFESCERGTLRQEINQRIADNTKFSDLEVEDISVQILTALADLLSHGSSYYQLNIKPENIGIKVENIKLRYKLFDFRELFNLSNLNEKSTFSYRNS